MSSRIPQSSENGCTPPEKFEKPVSWLVGRDLIAGLKWIALYTAFKGKIDPRDWMKPNAYPRFREASRCLDFWREHNDKNWRWKVENDSYWRAKEAEQPQFWKQHEGTPEDEFWFDYMSDTGDGQMAVYNVAYLCMSDLWVEASGRPGEPLAAAGETVELAEIDTHKQLLPRGQFLFVGGDTAYHIADYANLSVRFQSPFRWAFRSVREFLKRNNRLAATPDECGNIRPAPSSTHDGIWPCDSEPLRPIFGIPGNHDYYDVVDGFNRQFRKPATPEYGRRFRLSDESREELLLPQLSLPGFERQQQASYVAVHLPFGWWLWGLDTEVSQLDLRQQLFFRGLLDEGLPDKLIIATPEPSTVFRKQKEADDKTIQAFKQLLLPLPYRAEADETKGRCRLDLSGDVHHYARYYGPNTAGLSDPRMSSDHYASVVAGGGGAFHHPSETHASGSVVVTEQVLHPPADVSRRKVAGRLFDLRNIFHGGYVWLIGMIITGIIYFALTVPETTKNFLEWTLANARLPFTDRLLFQSDAKLPGVLPSPNFHRGIELQKFMLEALLLFLSLVVLGIAIYLFTRYIKRLTQVPTYAGDGPDEPPPAALATAEASDDAEGRHDASWPSSSTPPSSDERVPASYADLWPIFACIVGALVLYVFGIYRCVVFREDLHPFGSSLLILLHLIISGELLALSVQNAGWLVARQKFETGNRYRQMPVIMLNAVAVLITLFGFWAFGRYPAVYMLSDIIFSFVVLGVLFALIFVAAYIGGELQPGGGKFLMSLVGLWHALLQLVVPLLLVRLGNWLALLLAVVIILLFSGLSVPFTRISVRGIGARAMKHRGGVWRWVMTLVWLFYGAALLLLPFIFNHRSRLSLPPLPGETTERLYSSFLPQNSVDWLKSYYEAHGYSVGSAVWTMMGLSLAVAVAFGFILSMSWLSWYFGVSLGFQGHNNEVGGAARIENFKHIVRLRLTANDLTAYVIAVDNPLPDATKLKLKLIDVFRLKAS